MDGYKYFAQIVDPVSYVQECLGKVADWRDYCSRKGMSDLWANKLSNYYGMSSDGSSSQRVLSGGSQGELSNLKVNELHPLVQGQLTTVTSMRPAGHARAINSDVKSLKNARIGSAIAEYYLAQAGFESLFVKACETALLVDEAIVDLFWNKDAGDPIRPDIDPSTGQPIEDSQPIMSGDAQMRVHCPWNVSRDASVETDRQHWHIISVLFNRFDLAAQYPDFSEKILSAAQDNVPQLKLQVREGDDNVYAHLVIHDRTPAVPEGRYSLIVGDSLVADMPLPYPEYPVDRMTPSEVIDGPTGYCPSNDIMAMEQVTDALHGIITTNNLTFGGQSIVGPPLTGVVVSEIAKGLRYFELQPNMVDSIKPLQLTRSSPESFSYIGLLSSKKQEAVGSVAGTLQAQATQGASGSALALIQAQSVQYNSGTQRSYFRLLSRVMTKLIGVLRVYADTPRVTHIVGKSKSQGLKEFKYTGKDLNSISSIVYEMVNPVSQTIGGRLQLAQDLINNKMITNPRQYLTVVETGNLDVLTDPDADQNFLILEENELLSEGASVQAVVTENHADHIKAHMSVISTPEAKQDFKLVSSTMDHIQEHIDLWNWASINNPVILLATGQQPLPQIQQQTPTQVSGPQGNVQQVEGSPNAALEASQPNLPSLPKDPSTGQRVVIPGAEHLT